MLSIVLSDCIHNRRRFDSGSRVSTLLCVNTRDGSRTTAIPLAAVLCRGASEPDRLLAPRALRLAFTHAGTRHIHHPLPAVDLTTGSPMAFISLNGRELLPLAAARRTSRWLCAVALALEAAGAGRLVLAQNSSHDPRPPPLRSTSPTAGHAIFSSHYRRH